MCDHLWISQGNWSTTCQVNVAKDPHVLVGRHGIPIYEGPGEIVGLLRKYFDGQCIQAAGARHTLDIQFMEAERPCYLVRGGNLKTVEPDICAEVDAVEMQPDILTGITSREMKVSSVPPRRAKRTVFGHREI